MQFLRLFVFRYMVTVHISDITYTNLFSVPLAIGQRAYIMAQCPSGPTYVHILAQLSKPLLGLLVGYFSNILGYKKKKCSHT